MEKSQWKKYALGFVSASALVLAACGGDTAEDTGTDGEDTTESTEATGGSYDGQTLEVGVGADYVAYAEDIAADFEEEFGVTVEVTERDMFDTLEALPLDGPAELAPDVMLSPYDRIGGLGQQGHLAEVTLPDDERYDETDATQVTANDTIYGAPFVIEALVMYYNNDLVDKAPETFEELEALAEEERFAFEGEEGTSTAFLANWVDFYNSYGLISGFGGYVFGENGTDTSDVGLNNEGAIEGISYAADWFQNRWPEGMLDVTSAGDFIDDQFIQGNTAAIINGPWGAGNYNESGMDYGVAKVPTLPNGEEYAPFAGGKGWVINSYSETTGLAQEWLDFVTNEENMMLLFDEYTNEIPANQMARTQISDAGDNELAAAVIAQYDTAVPMPNIPEMAEVWTGAETMMFDAGSGNKTPEEAANDAVQIIEENIEQKY
ncbi:extracellular solute-binding protein [Lacticigenium naphthae]|uniref:extracellular solute-binding protein n=1 Tax=Lacticigenium naphthae TaxID=515351 RepID=UPI0004111EB0|nr:extracellular solute-binding protein [Lacticigenium naphthae]